MLPTSILAAKAAPWNLVWLRLGGSRSAVKALCARSRVASVIRKPATSPSPSFQCSKNTRQHHVRWKAALEYFGNIEKYKAHRDQACRIKRGVPLATALDLDVCAAER
jgi:hypothetical protein